MAEKKAIKSGKDKIVKPIGKKYEITKANGKKIIRIGMTKEGIKHHESIGNKVEEV